MTRKVLLFCIFILGVSAAASADARRGNIDPAELLEFGIESEGVRVERPEIEEEPVSAHEVATGEKPVAEAPLPLVKPETAGLSAEELVMQPVSTPQPEEPAPETVEWNGERVEIVSRAVEKPARKPPVPVQEEAIDVEPAVEELPVIEEEAATSEDPFLEELETASEEGVSEEEMAAPVPEEVFVWKGPRVDVVLPEEVKTPVAEIEPAAGVPLAEEDVIETEETPEEVTEEITKEIVVEAPEARPVADKVPVAVSGPVASCRYRHWVGYPVQMWRVKAEGRPYRILGPGARPTEDFNSERINIHVNKRGIVSRVECW